MNERSPHNLFSSIPQLVIPTAFFIVTIVLYEIEKEKTTVKVFDPP